MTPRLVATLVLAAGMALGAGHVPGVEIAVGAGMAAKRWVENENAELEMLKTVKAVRAGMNPHTAGTIARFAADAAPPR